MTAGVGAKPPQFPGPLRHERRRCSRERPKRRIERATGPRYLCGALMYWRNSADGKQACPRLMGEDEEGTRGQLALLIELGVERLDALIGQVMLGAQHINKLGAAEATARQRCRRAVPNSTGLNSKE
jgi:hypothetical protein